MVFPDVDDFGKKVVVVLIESSEATDDAELVWSVEEAPWYDPVAVQGSNPDRSSGGLGGVDPSGLLGFSSCEGGSCIG